MKKEISFYKYQSTGNDFVMIDGRNLPVNISLDEIKKICKRRFGAGADGLIILKNHPDLDFEMDYYNADGSQSMCGNGGRSAVMFARQLGIIKSEYHFLAIDGKHKAAFDADKNWINLQMMNVNEVDFRGRNFILNTGSPHYITITDDIKNVNVAEEGRKIRYNNEFKEKGINVNFVEPLDDTTIFVRTYERGVEDETYSCGTGVTAASLMSAHNDNGFNRIEVQTLGGKLAVEFDKKDEEHFESIWLCGPAEFVYEGKWKTEE